LPTTPADRQVSRLMYLSSEGDSEVALVCETSDGRYWTFITNSEFQGTSPETYLIRYDTKEQAEDFIRNYVIEEMLRMIRLNSDQPYEVTRYFKARDRKAMLRYSEYFGTDVEKAFKSGMEWILRSESDTRRPGWARYLVQNRNGVFTWFENKPHPNHSTGEWCSELGRSRRVVAHAESWTASIRKLT